jgi:hypothetical protein
MARPREYVAFIETLRLRGNYLQIRPPSLSLSDHRQRVR